LWPLSSLGPRVESLFIQSSRLRVLVLELSLAALSLSTSSEVKETVEDFTPRNICQPGASLAAMVAGESRLGVLAACRPPGIEAAGVLAG